VIRLSWLFFEAVTKQRQGKRKLFINAKAPRKAKQGAKGESSRFLKWFSLRAFFTPSRLCVKHFFGYRPVDFIITFTDLLPKH
jgi:hypothetical protein